jgi:mannose/fructose/N-acetylgalactosamine-specific phosphotransferase system component IID
MLGLLALTCSLLAGLAMAGNPRRSWVHVLAFATLMVGAMYITVDFEYPRLGIIRLDLFDHILVNLRATMQ